MGRLSTIAVDLTPVLPGGENGGAKVFALALVRALAALAPQARFVLLTQMSSHEELASLDSQNVSRVLAVGPAASAVRPRLFGLAARLVARLPGFARRRIARLGYRVHSLMKRGGPGGLLRGMGADLLFCPFTAPTFHAPGIPVVSTIYDLQFHAYPEFFSIEDAVQRERAFREACRRAARLAAISDFSRASAIAYAGLEPERIRTIHLRLARHAAPPAARSDSDASPQAARYLLYPANFWKHKNHELLLTAFGMACASGLGRDVKLVCTGAPGARQAWLERAACRMDLGERVIFPGFLPEGEWNALLAASAGVIFPSLYEGFGLPVIEAMAAGVPVACSNLTALPEVAGGAALLFDPRIPAQVAQAMATLVHDDATRARLIEAGRRRAAEFGDARRMAREYWELFESASEAGAPA